MSASAVVDKNQMKLSQIRELTQAYKRNKLEILSIIKSDFDINFAVPVNNRLQYDKTESALFGFTALHFVVNSNYRNSEYIIYLINLLLSRGADFTLKSRNSFSPLRLVFEQMMFSRKCQSEHSFYIPLINRLLLAHYESNNTDNLYCKNGISHFHIACAAKSPAIARFYLKAGVSVNEAIHKTSDILPGYSPLHIAIRNKDKAMVHLLLEHGADYNCLNADGMSPLQLLNHKHWGSELGRTQKVQFQSEALKNNAILDFVLQLRTNNFNPLDRIGLTKLHMHCIRRFNSDTFDEIEEYFMDNVDVNATTRLDSPVWAGYSALHFAAHCSKQMVILLLINGGNLFAKNANGTSPLDLCLKNFKLTWISYILKTDSTINSFRLYDAILLKSLPALRTTETLSEYLNKVNVNTAIPCNSLLWPGYTLLHLAVVLSKNLDTKNIYLCLRQGVDITVKDANGLTALELAFQMKKTGHVSAILEAYADDSHEIDKQNIKLFHIACAYRNEVVVKKFLSAGLDPDTPLPDDFKILLKSYHDRNQKGPSNLGRTSLLNAVHDFLSKNLAKLLLEFKADPHIVDADGFTWIHRSFFGFNSYYDNRNLLLPHIKAKKSNLIAPGGLSYLHIACYAGTTSIIKSLLTSKNVNEPITSELLKYIKHPPGFISVGDTPLHFAVKGGNEKNVMFLLSNGANAEVKNANGLTPFYLSLITSNQDQNQIIKHLLKKFNKNKTSDDVGLTRLHVACALRDIPLMKKLLKDGEDINHQINSDSPIWPSCTPTDLINMYRKYDVNDSDSIRVIVNHVLKIIEGSVLATDWESQASTKRRKVTLSKKDNRTINPKLLLFAFHYSCMGRHFDNVEKFIKFGVNVNAPNNYFVYCDAGFTPLHFAVKYGTTNVIEVLLQHGADITLEDSHGFTPLHLAAKYHPEKLEVFLRFCKADFEMKNTFGQTLMDLLLNNKNTYRKHFLALLKNDLAQSINFDTKISLVKTLMLMFTGDNLKSLIEYIPNVNAVHMDGRNIIHYLHLCGDSFCSIFDKFINNLEILLGSGCELDQQDINGYTPLHLAVQNNKLQYVKALMMVGADVNICDVSGRPAFWYCEDDDFVFDELNDHICKMSDAGLHVDPLNKAHSERFDIKDTVTLSKMKIENITKSFTLLDILTDEMVMEFPLMPLHQRQAILEYPDSNYFRRNYKKWVTVFKMQIRKALKRENLFKPAIVSLQHLIDPRLPVHCLEFILIRLSNDDLKNIVIAENGE